MKENIKSDTIMDSSKVWFFYIILQQSSNMIWSSLIFINAYDVICLYEGGIVLKQIKVLLVFCNNDGGSALVHRTRAIFGLYSLR
jgi:hypothetical protein